MKVLPLRLNPDQDLRQSLKDFALANNIQAGFILSAIGSLKQATLRFADQNASEVLPERFEILSLNGTRVENWQDWAALSAAIEAAAK